MIISSLNLLVTDLSVSPAATQMWIVVKFCKSVKPESVQISGCLIGPALHLRECSFHLQQLHIPLHFHKPARLPVAKSASAEGN